MDVGSHERRTTHIEQSRKRGQDPRQHIARTSRREHGRARRVDRHSFTGSPDQRARALEQHHGFGQSDGARQSAKAVRFDTFCAARGDARHFAGVGRQHQGAGRPAQRFRSSGKVRDGVCVHDDWLFHAQHDVLGDAARQRIEPEPRANRDGVRALQELVQRRLDALGVDAGRHRLEHPLVELCGRLR